MRCDDFRVMLEEERADALPELLRAHLEKCAECRAYAEDWSRLSEAFRAVAAEPLPEPTIGFAERLLRRLASSSGAERAATEFVERVGRRVALATMLLAMLTLLALGLPTSGPVREPASAEMMAQAEQVPSSNGIVFADDAWVNQAAAPERLNPQAGPSQK
jgi:predicted anti-sigma-YlaC factor YlaD